MRLVGEVQLKPGAEPFRVAEATERDAGTGDDCLPPGVPAATMLPFPLQIVHTPDVLAILYEAYHQFRIVPIGREHAEYLAPAWMGHSVARWDGDTLVVDVRGFNDRTVSPATATRKTLRVIERYRRTAYDTIEYEALVEDPNVFAAPLRYAGTLTLHPEWEIGEYVCAENNQDYDELFETDYRTQRLRVRAPSRGGSLARRFGRSPVQHAFAVRRRALHRVAMLAGCRRRVGRALEQARLAAAAARETVAQRMQADADDRAARKAVDADAFARRACRRRPSRRPRRSARPRRPSAPDRAPR